MGKLKIMEIVLSAISALVTIAKSVLKFIDYLIKTRNRPAMRKI